MIAYQKGLETLLRDNSSDTDWQKELEFFNTKLLHLQLERLIHLLVTLTVGFAALISCYVSMFNQIFPLFILDGILTMLFIAYIFHYRKLENTTQSLYPLMDTLKRKATK